MKELFKDIVNAVIMAILIGGPAAVYLYQMKP
jgi:hypothetical protein